MRRLKLNWINIKLVIIFGVIVFLFSFTSSRNERRKVGPPLVTFLGDSNLFITNETVNKLLIQNLAGASTIGKDKLALNKLEDVLDNNDRIEKAQVYITIDGVLQAEIKQKTPIVRVFNSGSSFYIDYNGGKMPLSDNYTARVPLVSGIVDEANRKQLNKLFRFIYDDHFLQKNIIGIQILSNGDVKMMNRNYNYEIEFGKIINIEKKFTNYKAFFQKAVQDSSIHNYNKVNLKFTQQVVCTKN